MFFKRFNKFRIIFIDKAFKFFEKNVFEQLSIFNESIIIYWKAQEVREKKDLIETKNSVKKWA